MKLIQNSNFRVQGMFFSTIVLRKIKTRHTLKKALLNPPPLEFFHKFIRFGSLTHPSEKIYKVGEVADFL